MHDSDSVIIIPLKLLKLFNPRNGDLAFLYKGLHFSLSEYVTFSKETTPIEIIDQSSSIFNIFEKALDKKVVFNESNVEYYPVLIVKSFKYNHLPYSVDIIANKNERA